MSFFGSLKNINKIHSVPTCVAGEGIVIVWMAAKNVVGSTSLFFYLNLTISKSVRKMEKRKSFAQLQEEEVGGGGELWKCFGRFLNKERWSMLG